MSDPNRLTGRRRRWVRPLVYGPLALLVLLFLTRTLLPAPWRWAAVKLTGGRTVSDVIHEIGPDVRSVWQARLAPMGLAYPPADVRLLALKHEKKLEVWSAAEKGGPKRLHVYDILAASGEPGPKRAEGDGQAPEGIYPILGLNPNSAFHLSMKVGYPGDFDRRMAEAEGRDNLGGDIFIHGSSVSIGCLAMGDEAIEELFVLVHDAGLEHVDVVIAPYDFRRPPPADYRPPEGPEWLDQLYETIRPRVEELKAAG